jgi:hypothetical protein
MDAKNDHEINCCPATLVLQQSAGHTSDAENTDSPRKAIGRCNGNLNPLNAGLLGICSSRF